MPWSIRKKRNQNLYTVKSLKSGKIINKGSTLEKCKAQIKFLGMLEGMKGGSLNDFENSHMSIQSVLFNKSLNTIRDADNWLKNHNFKVNKKTYNFKTTNFYRYRQHDPNENKYEYRLKEIDPQQKIYFVLEYKKYFFLYVLYACSIR